MYREGISSAVSVRECNANQRKNRLLFMPSTVHTGASVRFPAENPRQFQSDKPASRPCHAVRRCRGGLHDTVKRKRQDRSVVFVDFLPAMCFTEPVRKKSCKKLALHNLTSPEHRVVQAKDERRSDPCLAPPEVRCRAGPRLTPPPPQLLQEAYYCVRERVIINAAVASCLAGRVRFLRGQGKPAHPPAPPHWRNPCKKKNSFKNMPSASFSFRQSSQHWFGSDGIGTSLAEVDAKAAARRAGCRLQQLSPCHAARRCGCRACATRCVCASFCC